MCGIRSPPPAASTRSAPTEATFRLHPAGWPVQVVTALNAPTLCVQFDLAPPASLGGRSRC
jgi:hypothetical protein